MSGGYGHGRLTIFQSVALDDTRLACQHIVTLAQLGRHSDPDGWCWPSQLSLAKQRGLTVAAISKSIQHLAKCGYVQVFSGQGPHFAMGRPLSKYRLLLDFELPAEYRRYVEIEADPSIERATYSTPAVEKVERLIQLGDRTYSTERPTYSTGEGTYSTPGVEQNDPYETTHKNDPVERPSEGADAPPAAPSKPHRSALRITDEYVEQLVAEYGPRLGGEHKARDGIAAALNHTAMDKAKDKRLYLVRWLNRDVERYEERRHGTRDWAAGQFGRGYQDAGLAAGGHLPNAAARPPGPFAKFG